MGTFVRQARSVHGDRYSYSEVEYRGAHRKVVITCSKHGSFMQKPNDHLHEHGCPKCNRSIGEGRVARALKALNQDYQEQYRDRRCRATYTLPFDFAITRDGCVIGLIEFQGTQHFGEWGIPRRDEQEPLIERQRRDRIKQDFCRRQNIPLLAIPYWESNIKGAIRAFLENIGYSRNTHPCSARTPLNRCETSVALNLGIFPYQLEDRARCYPGLPGYRTNALAAGPGFRHSGNQLVILGRLRTATNSALGPRSCQPGERSRTCGFPFHTSNRCEQSDHHLGKWTEAVQISFLQVRSPRPTVSTVVER